MAGGRGLRDTVFHACDQAAAEQTAAMPLRLPRSRTGSIKGSIKGSESLTYLEDMTLPS